MEQGKNGSNKVKVSPRSNRLYFSMIYYVLSRKEVQKDKMDVKEICNTLQKYDVSMDITTIKRTLGDVAYQLLNVKSQTREKELFPFRLHCELPFSVEASSLFFKLFQKWTDTDMLDDGLTFEKMMQYFPIKKKTNGDMLIDIALPLSNDSDGESGEAESDFWIIVRDFLETYSTKKGTYFWGTKVRYSIEPKRLPVLEQKLLMDMIDGYSYITKADTVDFLRRLEDLSEGVSLNRYMNTSNVYGDIDAIYREKKIDVIMENEENKFFQNFSVVLKCILEGHKMRITYGIYDVDDEKKRPKLILKENYQTGKKIVSPYHSMWSNGYYYILVLYESHAQESLGKRSFSALRMDRILSAEEVLDEENKPEKVRNLSLPQGYNLKNERGFSTGKIAKSAVVMYTDKPEKVKFRCKKSLLNNVVDGFGFEVTVERIEAPKGERLEWIEVRTLASVQGTALWLTQHCADSYAVGPQSLVDKVKANLSSGIQYYLE